MPDVSFDDLQALFEDPTFPTWDEALEQANEQALITDQVHWVHRLPKNGRWFVLQLDERVTHRACSSPERRERWAGKRALLALTRRQGT